MGGQPRIIFINRFFYPDHSATSQMLSDLALALAKQGWRICVITSAQRYDEAHAGLPAREIVHGIDVWRIKTTHFGRDGLLGRAIDYATFYVSSALRLWSLAGRGDIVVAKTDPPMLSVLVGPIVRLRGAKLVNWLQDLFPEVAESIGLGRGNLARLGYRMLSNLRNRSLRRASMNVVLGSRMADRLTSLGVPDRSVRIISNWADGILIRPLNHCQNTLRQAWGLENKFVVCYSGNLGRAHEYKTFLDAIEHTEAAAGLRQPATPVQKDLPTPRASAHAIRDIVWLFVGGGALLRGLKAEVERRGFRSVEFHEYQPRARLAESLSVADVHLVSLRPELEGLIVPSKYYGIAAAGRPAIFIGDPDGEIARIITKDDTGFTIAPGDGAGLAARIQRLSNDPEGTRNMGCRARMAFDAHYDLDRAVKAWSALITEVAGPS